MTRSFLELSQLTTRFGDTLALDNVSLNVTQGEVVCLIGPSGCGKSTLLRSVNWLQPPDAGSVWLDNRPVGQIPETGGKRAHWRNPDLARQRAKMGMVFQNFNVWPHLSVLENIVRAQMVVLKRPRAEAETRARALLDEVGLGDRADYWPDDLSGGQKQRVAIARSLAMDPVLMLLDEPTSALDPELVSDVLGVLKTLAQRGMTMLIVTHELGFAAQVADRIVFMESGRIVEMGPPADLLEAPTTDRLRRFLDQLSTLNPFADAPHAPSAVATGA